nr:hypothetical protein [Mycobacterium vicinigordonae]
MTICNLSLAIERPADFAKVWEPHLMPLTKIITSCTQAGMVRTNLTPAQLTTALNTTLTALAQIGFFHLGGKGSTLTEDQLWSWCKQAVSPPVADIGKSMDSRPARKAAPRATSTRRVTKLTG